MEGGYDRVDWCILLAWKGYDLLISIASLHYRLGIVIILNDAIHSSSGRLGQPSVCAHVSRTLPRTPSKHIDQHDKRLDIEQCEWTDTAVIQLAGG